MDQTLSFAALFAAFVGALAGSLHCITMCGPLRLLLNGTKAHTAFYQGGRLLAYLGLGFGLGYLGSSIPFWLWIPIIAFVLLSYIGFNFPFLTKARAKILHLASLHPFGLGLASGLLPCGMLHLWLGTAVATRDPLFGAAILFSLWLGTLPALEISAAALRTPLLKFRSQYPRIMPIAFLLLALLPIFARSWHSFRFVNEPLRHEQEADPHCH